MADEIIQELWQIKDSIASTHNYDVKRLVKYLQEKERNGKHKIVDLRSTKRDAEPIVSADLQGSASLHPANR